MKLKTLALFLAVYYAALSLLFLVSDIDTIVTAAPVINALFIQTPWMLLFLYLLVDKKKET
jgi:hypothetical protein